MFNYVQWCPIFLKLRSRILTATHLIILGGGGGGGAEGFNPLAPPSGSSPGISYYFGFKFHSILASKTPLHESNIIEPKARQILRPETTYCYGIKIKGARDTTHEVLLRGLNF